MTHRSSCLKDEDWHWECNEGLAISSFEFQLIDMLRRLENSKKASHRLTHCEEGTPEDMPLNCRLPLSSRHRLAVSKEAHLAVAELFEKLSLKTRHATMKGMTNLDYGSHQLILCFSNDAHSSSRNFGEILLGEYENSHCSKKARSVTGLTKKTETIKVNFNFCKEVVKSLCEVHLPHPAGFIRINAVRGAATTPHTDNMRGPTVNLVNFHLAKDAGEFVNARIMVRCFPQFRTSVVKLGDNLFIPFMYTEAENSLVMIGHRDASLSYLLPQDWLKGTKGKRWQPRKKIIRGAAVFFEFPANVVDLLAPCGLLDFAVLGLKDGQLQTIPFLNPMDPAGESTYSSIVSRCISWEDAIQFSLMHPQPIGIIHEPPREIGNKANTWHQFYGWRFIHWFSGDPNIGRTHVFFRFVRESNSGGCLKTMFGMKCYVDLTSLLFSNTGISKPI